MIVTAYSLQLQNQHLLTSENYQKKLETHLTRLNLRSNNKKLVVLPPLIGTLYKTPEEYLEYHVSLTINNNMILIPGSYLLDGYHKSLVIINGKVVLEQKQTHLSQWDQNFITHRSNNLELVDIPIGKVGIMLGNDCYHPQVGRILAFLGADIIIALNVTPSPYNRWLQLSGVWQQVQQNQYFAIEVSFNGRIQDKDCKGRSIFHNPIWKDSKGILLEEGEDYEGFLFGEFDFEKLKGIRLEYPLLELLNKRMEV